MPPNAAMRGVDHGVDGREVAHVSLDGDRLAPAVADALRHSLGAVDVEVGNGNASALLGGLFGGGAPHASGCSRSPARPSLPIACRSLPWLLGVRRYFIIPPAGYGSKRRRREGRLQLGARIFVDGNNVMGSRPDRWWLDRRGAARRLLEQVAELARADSAKWTVVFDDRPQKHSAASPPVEGVTVEYPERRGRNGADNHIVRLLALLPQGSDVLLYTSDRNLRERAAATGARVEGARALLSRLEDLQQPRDSAIGEATLTTRPKISVRPATPDDVPQLMAFIRGIAEFEHLDAPVGGDGGGPALDAVRRLARRGGAAGLRRRCARGLRRLLPHFLDVSGPPRPYTWRTFTCGRSTVDGRAWARC